jgi:hypothetical protein
VTTKYETAVAEARQLVKRSEDDQWRLAELTWQQVESGKTRAQWAEDIGVHASHAARLYRLWARFGQDQDSVAFSDAYEAVRRAGDAAPSEARETVREKEAVGTVRNMPPERKAEIARELLADDDVAQAVVDHPETLRAVNRAVSRTPEGRESTRNLKAAEARREEAPPTLYTPLSLLPLLLGHASPLREAIEDITVAGATDDGRRFLKLLGEDLAATAQLFIAASAGATTKVTDEELQAWIGSER